MATRLYILKPRNPEVYPWDPWYDKAFGFVVCAHDAKEARLFASQQCGDEDSDCWLDPKLSSCKILNNKHKLGVVLRDYASA